MHGKDKYILAVDLGTSGPKTALVSIFGEVVDCEFEETPLLLTPGSFGDKVFVGGTLAGTRMYTCMQHDGEALNKTLEVWEHLLSFIPKS